MAGKLGFVAAASAVLLSFSSIVQAAPTPDNTLAKRSYSGQGTYYNGNGKLGSCGNAIDDGVPTVALPADFVEGPPNNFCGRSVSITGPTGTTTATVQDTCPECASGDLDMTPAAAKAVDSNIMTDGRIQITWDWA